MAGCSLIVGRWLPSAIIPVLVVCTQIVACRSSSSASVPTGEAATAVCDASVLFRGVGGYVVVCGYLRLFVVVTVAGHVIVTVWFCALWLLLCLWVACLAIIDTALGFCFKLKLLARRFHGGSRRTTKALQY